MLQLLQTACYHLPHKDVYIGLTDVLNDVEYNAMLDDMERYFIIDPGHIPN